jgi:2-hydroxycyclohexanecarboxyl-CoA dehydrogenase
METHGNGNHAAPRVALVTGGARGIGGAIAAALAADGFAVAVADLNVPQAEETAGSIVQAGGKAIGVRLDVTDSASVADGIAKVIEELGEIDVLVNNAGWDDLKPFVKTDEEFWDRIIEINFKGALRLTHGVLPGMLDRQWGRIINIGSDAGRVGSSLESVYSGAKGGVIAFTKTIAREVARKGVTANAVCPGPTNTPMLKEIVAKQGGDGDKVIAAMVSGVPMKRLAEPGEIAAAVRFFARDDAGYVTGQTLSVSGGLTMA